MDYNKMIDIRRKTNADDNAFSVPGPVKKNTDGDDGGSFSVNDRSIGEDADYPYYENEDTEKDSTKRLSKELMSHFPNEIHNVSVSVLEPYHTHTFLISVTDDFKESIRRMGVIEPLLITQSAKYGKYEVISGHRRLEAARAVGLTSLPCRIAREGTPCEVLDEIMVITNLQRRNTFTKMELARSLKLLNDSRKKQGYRSDISADCGISTKQELAKEFGISVRKMYMLISFTQLSDYFAEKVESEDISERIAYCISFLSEFEQRLAEGCLKSNPDITMTTDKAEKLKEKKEKEKSLDKRTIETIITATKMRKPSKTTTVRINTGICEKYGIRNKSDKELSQLIENALKLYFENTQEIE